MTPRLQQVSIPRPPGSEATTRQFYGSLLGLEEKAVPTSITSFDLIWFHLTGDTELHVYLEKNPDDANAQHFCLVVDDLQGLRQKLVDAGYEPEDGATVFGRPRFFCRDPFNNLIEFTHIEDDYMKFQGKLADD
jgi:extradiol dioxygenase family protein